MRGIFQTLDQDQCCRVLGWATDHKLNPCFILREGWYEVYIADRPDASRYAVLASVMANTSLVARPLNTFKQGDEIPPSIYPQG